MENLQHLIKTALIGTSRRKLPSLEPDLATNNTPKGLSPEEEVLQLSLIYSRIRRTGYRPAIFKDDLPDKAGKEVLRACSDLSAYHLLKIVESKSVTGIKDFLLHLEKAGRHIPVSLLPEVMTIGKQQKTWDELLKATMGKRGRWLIKQNPDWNYLDPAITENAWEVGTRAERVIWLRKTRVEDPDLAFENLLKTWETDSIEDHKAFLPELALNLSEKEEPFLEKCQKNSRKEIRNIAILLLYALKDSKVNQRMKVRLQTSILLEKNAANKVIHFDVSLPKAFDESMRMDGLAELNTTAVGGKKANWLRQMIGIVHPAFWKEYSGLSTDEIILLSYKSDWKEILLNGLIDSALRHNDKGYLKNLLEFWVDNINDTNLKSVKFSRLFSFLTKPTFQQIALIALKKDNILDNNNSVTQLLLKSTNVWSDELSLEVIDQIKKWLSASNDRWMGGHFKNLLKVAAYCISPKLHNQLEKDWPENSPHWSSIEREVFDFLSTLKLREEMIVEIYKE